MHKLKIIALSSLLSFGFSGIAHAADEAEDMIKYREKIMDANKYHLGAAEMIIKGEVSLKSHLLMHAQSLKHLLSDTTALFPEGSDFGDTSVKADVWEKPEKFKQASSDAADKANAFFDAVTSGDDAEIKSSFESLGKTCKGCHKPFKKKHDH